MKKTLSVFLAAILAASVLASCAAPVPAPAATSSANADLAWLGERLGSVPDNVTVGLASDLGIDMSAFENDGYLIRTTDGETVVAAKTADGLDRAVRAYAKAYESGEVADVTYHEGCRIKDLRIAGNPVADYTIVIPEDHHPNIDFAARELARLVEKATGVSLPTAVGNADGRKIVFTTTDDPSLRHDGYRYEVRDGDLVFTGAYDRGCSNAVWRFLENELDWLSLIYGTSYLTPADLVDIPEGTAKTETPSFMYYDIYTAYNFQYDNERTQPDYIENTSAVMGVCCHGMQNNHFAGYELDLAHEQMCYTSDEQYEIFYENVTWYIDYKLASGLTIGKDFLAVDIAQGDNDNWCTCTECRKLFQKQGTQAGPVVYHANRFCEDIEDIYPGLLVQIFAYSETKRPPKDLIPHKNVRVTFCYDTSCSNHKLDGTECGDNYLWTEENNTTLAAYFKKWAEISTDIYVWYYMLDQELLSYNIISNIYDDIRFLRDCGTAGFSIEAEANGIGLPIVVYKLLSELNWNTDMTEEEYEALLCRILESEYGDGWYLVRQYLDIWENAQDQVPCWHCWGGLHMYAWDDRFGVEYTERNFDTERVLFDEALKLCGSAQEEKNLELLSCPMLFTGVYASYYRAEARGDTERLAELSECYDLMVRRLIENGYDPLGRGINFPMVGRRTIPATASEWADLVRDEISQRLIDGHAGWRHGKNE